MTSEQSHLHHHTSRLDSLQQVHLELEQALQQSQQLLDLQLKLLNTQNTSSQNQAASDAVIAIIQSQATLRSLFTEHLLRRQVQVEREAEMKQIIHNYEKRIYDLRAILIYKEAEIQYLAEEVVHAPFKKNDIKHVSSQTLERIALLKAIQERKKLAVEVEALQHTLKSSHAVSTPSSPIVKRVKILEYLSPGGCPGKENLIQRDGLTDRAMSAIIEQHQRENSLYREYSLLKRQLIGLQDARQSFKKKYLQLTSSRKRQADPSIQRSKSVRILDTIDEASESKVSTQIDYHHLLVNIELNQPEVLSPTTKGKRKVTTFKQRNSKRHKEN